MNSKLYDIYRNPPAPTKDVIYKIFELMLAEFSEVKPYINDFQVTHANNDALGSCDNEDKAVLGSYDNEDKIVTINMLNIISDDSINNKFIQIIETIRHEIEHANNLRKLHTKGNDIETTLIRYSLIDYAMQNHLGYLSPFDMNHYEPRYAAYKKSLNYESDPAERIARINAWKYVVNLLKNRRGSSDLHEASKNLFYAYVCGYKNNDYGLNPPTYEYLLNLGFYHEFYLLKKRVEEKKYCFNTRLKYGLPLSENEYYKKILDDKFTKDNSNNIKSHILKLYKETKK